MRAYTGRVVEVQLDPSGASAAWIACPQVAIPAPGQYLLAENDGSVLAEAVFSSESSPLGFLTVPPIPRAWEPGTQLNLRGPMGRGFSLPDNLRKVALAALGGSVARLLPLAIQAMRNGAAAALFSDAPLPSLPSDLEAHPLGTLPEALSWAEFLGLDLPMEHLPDLREVIGLAVDARMPCPAQALLVTPMPCGGLADCGVCAVPARRSWKLACKEGPVFDLEELDW